MPRFIYGFKRRTVLPPSRIKTQVRAFTKAKPKLHVIAATKEHGFHEPWVMKGTSA